MITAMMIHKRVGGYLAALILSSAAMVIAVPAPAHAAARCVTDTEWGLFGNVNTVTLRGISVKLQSGRSSAAARAQATVPPGATLQIDRSINQFTPTAAEQRAGHGWRTNGQVSSNGGYDYCEAPNNSSRPQQYSTKSVEGSKNAVRQCMRHNGSLECSSRWYVDFDD
jgi:hypothetical protein